MSELQKVKSARWRDRFFAWLIDILLLSIPWYMIVNTLSINLPSLAGLGCLSILSFIYWTALEGYRGQSIGKMVQNLMVVGSDGEKIGFADAAIQSFGKAFLLPFDCLLGWFAMPVRGKRLFNGISGTIVTGAEEEGVWCCKRCS
jgi:uncharacterized RDD family membrane protein YckC